MLLAFDDQGPGPVIVLLHGFPLDRTMWSGQIAGIGDTYRIIAPDLRGHGQTAAPDGANRPAARPISEGTGSLIGPYKLREKIGEGGMGVVYLAEQEKPVRRKVALKIIKPGMDTEQVVARFEAERQALALMDHPNIAKVLDGGRTESGRPYFVMEYVKGVPITEYSDATRLRVE